MQVLGVFEKLVASKNTDHQGVFILNTVVENLSYEALSPFMAQIWNILFSRLQYRSTWTKWQAMWLCMPNSTMQLKGMATVGANGGLNGTFPGNSPGNLPTV